jgi:hypothetical protein
MFVRALHGGHKRYILPIFPFWGRYYSAYGHELILWLLIAVAWYTLILEPFTAPCLLRTFTTPYPKYARPWRVVSFMYKFNYCLITSCRSTVRPRLFPYAWIRECMFRLESSSRPFWAFLWKGSSCVPDESQIMARLCETWTSPRVSWLKQASITNSLFLR